MIPPTRPLLGHCGNWAGPSGMGAAVAIGFFPSLSAHAVQPYSVWDAVPGDLVASAILGTAAAVAAGLQADIVAATGCGAWEGARGVPAVSGLVAATGGLAAILKGLASKARAAPATKRRGPETLAAKTPPMVGSPSVPITAR